MEVMCAFLRTKIKTEQTLRVKCPKMGVEFWDEKRLNACGAMLHPLWHFICAMVGFLCF